MSHISGVEKVLIVVFGLILCVLFANATRINWITQQLDQAYFLESIDTTFETGRSTTMLTRSAIHAIQDLIVAPAPQVCEYEFQNDGKERMSIYERHSFPILYLLAGLRIFFSSQTIYYFCAIVAFPALLILVYLSSRRLGVPIILSGALTCVIAFHPAWSYSSFGQFYPDKLFPILCLTYFIFLHDWIVFERRRPFAIFVIGIIAASTSERSIIMLIAGTLAVYVLFGKRRRWSRLDILPLILVALLGIYLYLYMHFLQHDSDYTFFLSTVLNFLTVIKKNTLTAKAIYKFLAINVLLLAPLGLFAKRWALIALCSMIPNLLGSIAGAEKLGWTTHYHSSYFPFLVFTVILGASSLVPKQSRRLSGLALGLAIALTLFYAFLDPFAPPSLRFSLKQARETGLAKTVEFTTGTGPAAAIINRSEYLKTIATFLPPESEVSTTESYMPALYDHGVKLIHFYPLGMGAADYLIVPYTQAYFQLRYQGFVSYLGQDVVEQANSCLQSRIDEEYALVKSFPDSPLTGTAVLQRKGKYR